MMPSGNRIEGVGMGSRVICKLVEQVGSRALPVLQFFDHSLRSDLLVWNPQLTNLAGRAALQHMIVVLHLSEDREGEVTQELFERGFYGLKRDNFLFLSQDMQPGFRFDDLERRFVKSEIGGRPMPLGSGFGMAQVGDAVEVRTCIEVQEHEQIGEDSPLSLSALCLQMAWPSEAFILDENGLRQSLPLPVLEMLDQRGVEWVVNRRMRDLQTLGEGGLFDLGGLAYRFRLLDQQLKVKRRVVLMKTIHCLKSLSNTFIVLLPSGSWAPG